MPRRSNTTPDLLVGPDAAHVVYLLDVAIDLEERLLANWIASWITPPAETIRIRSSRRGKGGDPEALAKAIDSEDNPFLIPVRVVWMAQKKEGRRSVRWSDAFKPGDPRDPRGPRAYWIRVTHPSRVKLIAAIGAHVEELANDYTSSGEIDGVDRYVTRRAWRVLDQAERKLRGNRYKIPRFVPEAILSRREFIETVENVGAVEGLNATEASTKAERYLREIAATHSPYVIDLVANGIHALYRQGYGKITY